jgi:GT2 family glycosyltransferase
MEVRWITSDHELRPERSDVVVCIPVYGAHELFVRCLDSVLAHTPSDVHILICDDASPDARSREVVARLGNAGETDHTVFYMRQERNVGFPANVNTGFAIAAPADVVVLNSDCVVADGWLAGLRDAAYSDSRVATATTLTNNGTLVSVPERRPAPALPSGWSLDDAARAIWTRSLRIYPRLPTAIGHCVYFRRSALELVGAFDLVFTPGYGEEVDFSQRCRKTGLCHVLADDVFVLHHGGASFSATGAREAVQAERERIINARYPYYYAEVRALDQDVSGPLARALGAARRALKGLSVLIDARVLAGPMTGTQLQVLEVISALDRTGRVRLTVLVGDELSDYARRAFAAMPEVRVVIRDELLVNWEPADVVHRPYQISNADDAAYLAALGQRLIVTNQDLIAYHNPSYFADAAGWDGFRRLTRTALAAADHVVFVSEHARADALTEDLVEPGRSSTVHNGVDHSAITTREAPVAPAAAAALPASAETILCIGTDFRHKNRLFALRMVRELQLRHGWEGYLVLAGPRVQYGSSTSDEVELLALHRSLAGRVLDVVAVTEAEKAWLFGRARLVVYPTVHEGFGLVPFEAADHGAPCMWAAGTSLAEVLPDEAAAIVPWDPAQSANRALELMRNEEERERNLRLIRGAGEALTWDGAARKLTEIYESTCAAPAAPAGAMQRRQGGPPVQLSEEAMMLLGPRGVLPRDLERPLLALATHPQIGDPVFRAIRAGYRASFRLRRGGRQRADATVAEDQTRSATTSNEVPAGHRRRKRRLARPMR